MQSIIPNIPDNKNSEVVEIFFEKIFVKCKLTYYQSFLRLGFIKKGIQILKMQDELS